MSLRPYRDIHRRACRQVMVGNVAVGGGAPISVQSMTTTLTHDVPATVAQIHALEEAGADIVRVSCPDEASSAALRDIVDQTTVPIIADIHFHYRRALEAADNGAACLRINPGNIGAESRVREVVQAARANGCSMRIGVNAGSLEKELLERYGEPCPEAMVESALNHARLLEDNNFGDFKISVKASDVFLSVAAYQALADACDYPLHLGITEAGALRGGTVKSSIGLGNLLWAGIGDTIRVSLSADPVEEIHAGFEILKSLGLRHRGVSIVSCPSCARQARRGARRNACTTCSRLPAATVSHRASSDSEDLQGALPSSVPSLSWSFHDLCAARQITAEYIAVNLRNCPSTVRRKTEHDRRTQKTAACPHRRRRRGPPHVLGPV